MKKNSCIFFAVVFVLGLFMVTANAQATEAEASKIQLSGLIEFGGAWQDASYVDGTDKKESDLCLTTLELGAEAEVNEWVNVAVLLLYEDATSFEGANDETSVDLDEATLTIGNTEKYPVYVSGGAMYVPFGALLTNFPDDPLIDGPVTLVLGEIREKALLVGFEQAGFSASGYVFNGDMDEAGQTNHVETYGLDANYSLEDDLLVGASYISNIADSDGLTDALHEKAITTVLDHVAGFDAYLHVGMDAFALDAEYMTALDEFAATEFATAGVGSEPAVWNIEVSYNLDVGGKNLQIALQYAGSDEAGEIGIPETRYGIALNHDLFEDVIASLAYLNDEFEVEDPHGRDDRDVLMAQIAIEF